MYIQEVIRYMFGFGKKDSNLTPQQIQQRVDAGEALFILDVREPSEYAEARVAKSKLIPLGELSSRVAELPRDKPIAVICRSGNRSGVATGMLKRAGFETVYNVDGGLIAWARQGLPVEAPGNHKKRR
jgi:sulfur-carrier protein adenylyltransferase/sulfurtransferase